MSWSCCFHVEWKFMLSMSLCVWYVSSLNTCGGEDISHMKTKNTSILTRETHIETSMSLNKWDHYGWVEKSRIE